MFLTNPAVIQVVLPTKSIRNEKILETLMVQANSGMYRVQDSYLENVQKQGSSKESRFQTTVTYLHCICVSIQVALI